MRSTTVRSALACTAAGLLAAASLAAVPASPDVGGPSAAAPPTARAVTTTADGVEAVAGRPDPRSLVREAGGLSAAALGDIVRAHVARTAGVGHDPLLAEDSDDGGTEEAPVAEEGDGVRVRALPSGDLDGDGLDDVLTVETDADAHTVIARRGVDGSELWRSGEVALTDLYGFAGPDLTGDGADDLILWELRWDDGPLVTMCGQGPDHHECEEEWTATFTWTVAVVDGTDGSAVWTRETHGEVDYRRVDSYERDVVEGERWRTEVDYDAVGDLVLPVISGDHDGDGLPDVLLNRIDAVDYSSRSERHEMGPDAPVVGHSAVSESHDISLALDSAVEAAEGTTGRSLATVEDTDGPAQLWGLPLGGDATGDGVDDVVVLRYQYETGSGECVRGGVVGAEVPGACSEEHESEFAVSVRLLDGGDLGTVWERDHDAELAFPSGRDHTGDGAPDLLFISFGPEAAVGVVSGVDGATAWQQSDDDLIGLLPLDDLDGDGTADVLVVALEGEFEGQAFVLRRLTGPAGTEITDSRRDLGDGGAFVLLHAGDVDADGDGGQDIVVDVRRFHRDGDETRALDIERGRDAELVWRTTDVGPSLWNIADLDGDGADDVVLARFDDHEWACCELGYDLEVVRALDGVSLWRLDGLELFSAPAYIAGDLDGDGGADVLHHHASDDATYASGVRARSGADLGVLWLAGGPPA